jgi:hypothetical protein
VHEPDAPGLVGIEALAADAVAARLAHADRGAQLRHDRRRDHAEAHLGQREARGLAGDRYVAARDQADPAAVAGALDQRERRLRQRVQLAHRLGRAPGEVRVLGGAGAAHPAQPVQIGAGLEVLALAAQDHDPDPRIAAQRLERRAELVDQRAVVGVVHLGPVQDHARDPATIDFAQHQLLGHLIDSSRSGLPGGAGPDRPVAPVAVCGPARRQDPERLA